ncbi:MAG: hypothetical protein CM1200mP29_11560 [Verrucomicrobiota bacterium]|nr:MAG: hypothetical protein CM1200mP29_11560 [Verrucomicrobiota bacterium]
MFHDSGGPPVSRFYRCATRVDVTWGIIRDRILGPSCAGCHSEGTTFPNSRSFCYAGCCLRTALNRKPANTYALDEGLELVGTEGLASVAKVFCGRKSIPPRGSIFRRPPRYGSLCLRRRSAYRRELKFFLQWILEGAPEHGSWPRSPA